MVLWVPVDSRVLPVTRDFPDYKEQREIRVHSVLLVRSDLLEELETPVIRDHSER